MRGISSVEKLLQCEGEIMDNSGLTKKFLSLPPRTLRFTLKAAFLEAISKSITTQVSYRLRGIKYDEDSPILLLDVNNYHNICVGDVVDILKEPYGLKTGSLWWDEPLADHSFSKANRQETEPCLVAGFIKLEGNMMNNSKAKIETMFCAVAPLKNLFAWISKEMTLLEGCILQAKISSTMDPKPLLLFWVEGLEKISDYQHIN